MNANLFEEFHRKKENLKSLAIKAFDNKWIDEQRKNDIINGIDNDILTIGVIGQMKCGKSTFLNSFVFEDDVLPAATTPMTAALSKITYGPEKKIVAEFYTKEEWLDLKQTAQQSLDDVPKDSLLESKIKAAKDLVERSSYLGSSLESYLGKPQEDSLDQLEQYVGAEGKYISITKSVTIYYPKEYLKGVEIVDTPGFNDPIVSREERTKEFLKKAHVVLLMLYAGRPFDATDRNILFKNVGECGTGKVLIGINKYDIPYCNGETEPEIVDYVRKELRKACEEESDPALAEIVQNTEPIVLSAEMALLSELSMTKIGSVEAYQFAYNRHCKNFEILSQNELRDKSHIDQLILAIKEMIEKEKESILSQKPINAIIAAGNKKKDELSALIRTTKSIVKDCTSSDDELEDKQKNYKRASSRLVKKIDGVSYNLDDVFKKIIHKSAIILEDDIDSCCNKLTKLVDEIGRFDDFSKIKYRWNSYINTLITRTLKRHVKEIEENSKTEVSKVLSDFLSDAEDILYKYVDKDFEVDDLIKEASHNIEYETIDKSLFEVDNSDDDSETGLFETICIGIYKLENLLSLGGFRKILNAFGHGELVNSANEAIENLRTQSNVEECLNHIKDSKERIVNNITKIFINQCLNPIQEELQKTIDDVNGRKEKLEKAQADLESLEIQLNSVVKQIAEINSMVK